MWFCWILKWRLTSIKLNVYAIPKQHRRKQNIEIYGTKAHHCKSFQLKVHVKFCCFWSTLQPESDQHLISPYNTIPESDIKVKRSPVITNKTLQLSTWPHNTGRQIGDFPCNLVAKIFLLSPCRLNWLKLGALTTSQSTILGWVIQFKPSLSS